MILGGGLCLLVGCSEEEYVEMDIRLILQGSVNDLKLVAIVGMVDFP